MLLLSQSLKKNPKTILAIAIFIICIRVVDVFWLVEPNFADVDHPVVHDFVAGLHGAARLRRTVAGDVLPNLPQRPLLPLGAPDLEKALNHGRDH